MDPTIHCPQCHTTLTPGALVCEFCGYRPSDALIVVEEKRTWQETAYLVASVVMILQALMWGAIGLGLLSPAHFFDGYAYFAYVGAAGVALGVGLLRCMVWAQWVARIAGIPALLWYGQVGLSNGLAVGVVPFASSWCLFGSAWFLYWALLEYLIWAVAD